MTGETGVVRYESPDVFEALTKEWSAEGPHKKRRRRKSKAKVAEEAAVDATESSTESAAAPVDAITDSPIIEAQTV